MAMMVVVVVVLVVVEVVVVVVAVAEMVLTSVREEVMVGVVVLVGKVRKDM